MTWPVFESHQWKESRRLLGIIRNLGLGLLTDADDVFIQWDLWCNLKFHVIMFPPFLTMIETYSSFWNTNLLKNQFLSLRDSWVWMGFGSFGRKSGESVSSAQEGVGSSARQSDTTCQSTQMKFPQMMKPDVFRSATPVSWVFVFPDLGAVGFIRSYLPTVHSLQK